MKRSLFVLTVLLILAGCAKPAIPAKLIAYQRIAGIGNNNVCLIASDLVSKPYRTYLLVSDMDNNISFEKSLGDGYIFSDSEDQGDGFLVLMRERDAYTSKLIKFDYNGKIIKEKDYNIQGVELSFFENGELLIGGQIEQNEVGYVRLKANWDLIVTSVVPGTAFRSIAVFNNKPYLASFNHEDSTASIFGDNNKKHYSIDCQPKTTCKLTVKDMKLKLHWIGDDGAIHINDFDKTIKLVDETLLPTERGENFTVKYFGEDTYYSVMTLNDKNGIGGTKILKQSPTKFTEVTIPNMDDVTLASTFIKDDNIFLSFFSLANQGNRNGFHLIK
ncbi:MAG: hypothetical protein P9L91_02265 [Candidatus Zophobacter franzmannii]|nr:hypothetical protein [Candidatus Zophobacter franzmannii]